MNHPPQVASRIGLRRWRSVLLLAATAGGLALALPLAMAPRAPARKNLPGATTLQELLVSGSSLNEHHDIAALNMLCAEKLPGAQNLDQAQCLATIDQWAQHVRSETDRHLYRFRASPAEFEYSEGYFRMLMMAVILYEDFGIRYNPERIGTSPAPLDNDRFFSDSRDIFLHGLCGPGRAGTCSSMPVLYAAIGRRLGYPLKLATTKSHLFLRWEGSGERFNLEATGKGMNRYDDEHFRQWPFPVTDAEAAAEGYLKSLSPAEEMALFLSLRGHCLRQARRTDEAIAAYASAARLAPECRGYGLLLADAQQAASRASTQTRAGAAPGTATQALPSMAPRDPNPLSQIRSPQQSTTEFP